MTGEGKINAIGQVKEITSTSNPIIKEIKSLALKKNRDELKLFVAEGQKFVIDALEKGWKIDKLIVAKKLKEQESAMQIAAKARTSGALIIEANDKVLSTISKRDNPQLMIGVFRQVWHSFEEITDAELSNGDVIIALDRVRDPGNLGTIIRTGDAVGTQAIILIDDTVDPFSIETVRATMGSIFNMKFCRIKSDEFAQWAKTTKINIIGTHLEGSVDYRTIEYDHGPNMLLMGNEQQGLTSELVDTCKLLAFIPMQGSADSLNLAISTGIMLFEMRKTFLKMPDRAT